VLAAAVLGLLLCCCVRGRRWRLDCCFFRDLSLRADAVATKRELAACTDGEGEGLGSVRVLLWHYLPPATAAVLALLAVSIPCVKRGGAD